MMFLLVQAPSIVSWNNFEKNSFISTGSVVKSNVEPYEIVEGNPAKKVGYLENK